MKIIAGSHLADGWPILSVPRTWRRVHTQGFEVLYDVAGRAVTLIDLSGVWAYGEIYAGGRHLATYSGATTNFLHTDWLGTKRVMSSVSGSNSETCTGFPFADGVSCTGTNWTLNGFTDDVHDTESNLEHVWFRQLSGTQGRWTSPDPYLGSMDTSNPQSLNRYGYVLNDPAGSVDPSGLVVNVPTAVIDSFDGKTVLYEYFIDDGPELSFPRNFGGGGGGGGGDILGGILGALNGGGSISGNCFLPGACPNLSVPSILDFLPKLPARGCDPGPCSFASIPILTPAPSPSAKVGQGILDLANFLITTAAAAIHSAFWHRDPPLRINGTHYCGPGGAGDPINAADRACAAHDQCYIDNGLTPTDNFRQLSPDKAAAMQACNQALCNAARATNSSTGRIIDDYFSSTGNYRCR